MSLRSVVNFSKADSMAEVSVLASTTRKFFWLSGGEVTCWRGEGGEVSIGRGEGVGGGLGEENIHQCRRGEGQ